MATIAPAPGLDVPLSAIDVTDATLYANDSWRPVFARLRAQAPVHHQPHSPFGPYWSVNRHADIMAVEARPEPSGTRVTERVRQTLLRLAG